jgi:hypothetical protein
VKRAAAVLLIICALCAFAIAADDPVSLLLEYPEPLVRAAMLAVPPEGLTEREVDLYRLGFADGLNAATSRAYRGEEEMLYIINTATKKFHDPECRNANTMATVKREERYCTRQELIDEGLVPCKNCNP